MVEWLYLCAMAHVWGYHYPLSYLASLTQVLEAIHKLCCPFDSVIKGVPVYAEDDSLHFL